jgi:hypothetical protein
VIQVKTSILIALALLLCVSTSSAQSVAGSVNPYADAAGTECNIVDDGGMVQVHMLHVGTNGAAAVEFKLDVSATDWIFLGDVWSFVLVLGTSVDGAALAYQKCLTGSIHLGYASFIGASAPPCTEIDIVPNPEAPTGRIVAIDCDEQHIFPGGGLAYINPDPSCQCSVPVEETTWGGIKALYR